MKTNGANIITTWLEQLGVHTVAGIPGGSVLPLYDALRSSPIRHVLARHEQGAGFIAQGMARTTGRAGVCIGTSGPGATNLLTAIADAHMDSVPLVAITGQVESNLIGTMAFQEVDTIRLTAAICKRNFAIRRASDLLEVIPKAFEVAETGRPGPVVIDVPKDVFKQEVELEAWPELDGGIRRQVATDSEIQALAAAIARSERPMLYVGGGIIASKASAALLAFAERSSIPVTTTLNGIGAFPSTHTLSLGMLGMHGARSTNLALDEADLLIAIGVRFDDRATGKVEQFCRHATIVHVDIDPSEIGKIRAANLGIVAEARDTLERALAHIEARSRSAWNARIRELRSRFPMPGMDNGDLSHPVGLIRWLSEHLPPDTIITTDVGQHQMWVAQHFAFQTPRSLLTSGGLGTMGFGLPAAIGAALAHRRRKVVCISGDGSILMNIQELATLAELDLNVTVLVLNNQHLGLVRQQQELFFGARYHGSMFQQSPSFAAIAEGFGVIGVDMGRSPHRARTLEAALGLSGPSLVDIPIPAMENVLPMVPPGSANTSSIEEPPQRASVGTRA